MNLLPFDLPFKYPFTISRYTKKSQPLLVVQLVHGKRYGLGETADNSYYKHTIESLINDLEQVRSVIESYNFGDPTVFWDKLYPHLKHNMFALCAVDEAIWDLYAQEKGKKLYEVWGANIKKNPLTDITIGIDSIEMMVKKVKERPWPIYKIKLGTKEDIAIVRALRKETDAIFRVDANTAWEVEETIENAKALKDLGVEYIEQPLPNAGNDSKAWERQKEVYERSVLPIVADESCILETDVQRCIGYFHGINIKLVKCGGLTPALRMIREARANHLSLMIGCMMEGTVGVSASAHLVPFLDYIDLDGALLLAKDSATGITCDYGKIIYADRPGTGARLIDE